MDPFKDTLRYHKPLETKCSSSSSQHLHVKKAQSLSRIQNMTVGDVRQCFSEMRSTHNLASCTVLWCGLTAGQFALQYLVNTTGSSRKRRTSFSYPTDSLADTVTDGITC